MGKLKGEVRQMLEQAIGTPGTSRQLAVRTGVGFEAARRTLDDMVKAGVAVKGVPVRVEGVKRPVPVYGQPRPQVREPSALDLWLASCDVAGRR